MFFLILICDSLTTSQNLTSCRHHLVPRGPGGWHHRRWLRCGCSGGTVGGTWPAWGSVPSRSSSCTGQETPRQENPSSGGTGSGGRGEPNSEHTGCCHRGDRKTFWSPVWKCLTLASPAGGIKNNSVAENKEKCLNRLINRWWGLLIICSRAFASMTSTVHTDIMSQLNFCLIFCWSFNIQRNLLLKHQVTRQSEEVTNVTKRNVTQASSTMREEPNYCCFKRCYLDFLHVYTYTHS